MILLFERFTHSSTYNSSVNSQRLANFVLEKKSNSFDQSINQSFEGYLRTKKIGSEEHIFSNVWQENVVKNFKLMIY